jgi:hypothetical protein
MRNVLIFVGATVAVALVALVLVPLMIHWSADFADEAALEPSPTVEQGAMNAAKNLIRENCISLIRKEIPDPAKTDQVRYACNCVVAELEPQLPGRTVAEVTLMATHLEDGAEDVITKCAEQVGLVQ